MLDREPNETRRFLCVCAGGNSRSHAMAFMLKNYWHVQAIAIGVATGTSLPTLDMLFEWADEIVIMHSELYGHVPAQFDDKKTLCDVGEDTYFRGIHPSLGKQCVEWISDSLGEPVPEHKETITKWLGQ